MSRVVGIDLGTSNSLVAYMDGGGPRGIAGPAGSKLVPPVIGFDAGQAVIGEQARARRITRVDSTVYSVKRFMGKGIEDLSAELAYLPFSLPATSARLSRSKWPGGTTLLWSFRH